MFVTTPSIEEDCDKFLEKTREKMLWGEFGALHKRLTSTFEDWNVMVLFHTRMFMKINASIQFRRLKGKSEENWGEGEV